MAIAESAIRIVAGLVSIIQTRLKLIAIEVEEESLRLFSYAVAILGAMFCLGIAVLLSILLVIIIYWDTHRITALLSLIGFFALVGGIISWKVFHAYRRKPPLLTHTLAELSDDLAQLKSTSHE